MKRSRILILFLCLCSSYIYKKKDSGVWAQKMDSKHSSLQLHGPKEDLVCGTRREPICLEKMGVFLVKEGGATLLSIEWHSLFRMGREVFYRYFSHSSINKFIGQTHYSERFIDYHVFWTQLGGFAKLFCLEAGGDKAIWPVEKDITFSTKSTFLKMIETSPKLEVISSTSFETLTILRNSKFHPKA